MGPEHSHLRTIVNQDGAAILDSTTGVITALNSTGAFVWQGLERGEDPALIAQELARETGREVEVLERDVRKFVDALREQRLLAY